MALQEFLASYAVQVDEDGARRLQAILDQNRESGEALASVFERAHTALTTLKRELSDSSGLRDAISSLSSSFSSLPKISSSALSGLSSSGQTFSGDSGLSAGITKLSITADFSAAEEAYASYKARIEADRPMLQVNATGITSAVSSAIATVRSMMSSLQLTIPVKVKAELDSSGLSSGISKITSSLNSGGAGGSDSSGSSGGTGSSGGSGGSSDSGSSSGGSNASGNSSGSMSIAAFGIGGRVENPTLAMIAEEGEPEYVIPTDNDNRAVPLLRSLLAELSDGAKTSLLSDLIPGGFPGHDAASSASGSMNLNGEEDPAASRKSISSILSNVSLDGLTGRKGAPEIWRDFDKQDTAAKTSELSRLLSPLSDLPDPSGLLESTVELMGYSGTFTSLSESLESFHRLDGFSALPQIAGLLASLPESLSFSSGPLNYPEFPDISGYMSPLSELPGISGLLASLPEFAEISGFLSPLSELPDISGMLATLPEWPAASTSLDDSPDFPDVSDLLPPAASLPDIPDILSAFSDILPSSDRPASSLETTDPTESFAALRNISSQLAQLPGLPDVPSMPVNPSKFPDISGQLSALPTVLSDLSAAARSAFLPAGFAAGSTTQTVQAPVNILVSTGAAAPEAVARSVYDVAQRSLLKTLEGVFV